MRKTVAAMTLVAVTLGTGVALAPGAAAVGNNTTIGGCGYNADRVDAVTGTRYTGVVHEASVTHDPFGLPIGATVSCKIEVNGVDAPGTTFSYLGYGEQAGADQLSFEAGDTDTVQMCQRTVYADNTDSGWNCPGAHNLILPPQEFVDTINFVTDVIDNVYFWDIDPRACPILAAHPGTYGPITVNADGDVYVADPLDLVLGPVEDCPPYGNF